jgi:hypothetical protein
VRPTRPFARVLRGAPLLLLLLLSARPANAVPSPAEKVAQLVAQRTRGVLDAWIRSLGGPDRVRKLRSIEMDQRIGGEAGPAWSAAFHSVETSEGHLRYDYSSAENISSAYDGKTAWYESSRLGFGHVAPAEVRGLLWRSDALRAGRLTDYYPNPSYLQQVVIKGQPCSQVEMSDAGGGTEWWYFSTKTGSLIRIERLATATTAYVEMDYSDFRKVSRLLLPFRAEQTINHQKTVGIRLNLIVDGAVTEELFSPTRTALQEAETIQSTLDRYQATLNGPKGSPPVHSRVTHALLTTQATGVTSRITLSQKDPNLILREEDIPGFGKIDSGFDGQTGWVNGEIQGFRIMKGEALAQWRANAGLEGRMDLIPQLPLRKLLGQIEIRGRRVYQIALATISAPAGVYFFDTQNGLLLRTETQFKTSAGATYPATIDYEDFRAVEGVSIPFRTTWTAPTAKYITTYESVVLNPPLPDDLFKPRHDD